MVIEIKGLYMNISIFSSHDVFIEKRKGNAIRNLFLDKRIRDPYTFFLL